MNIVLNSFQYCSGFMTMCPESVCLPRTCLKPTKAKSESFQNFNARRILAWVGLGLDFQTGSSFSFPRFAHQGSGKRASGIALPRTHARWLARGAPRTLALSTRRGGAGEIRQPGSDQVRYFTPVMTFTQSTISIIAFTTQIIRLSHSSPRNNYKVKRL